MTAKFCPLTRKSSLPLALFVTSRCGAAPSLHFSPGTPFGLSWIMNRYGEFDRHRKAFQRCLCCRR